MGREKEHCKHYILASSLKQEGEGKEGKEGERDEGKREEGKVRGND